MRKNLVIKPLKVSDIKYIMTWVNDPDVVKNLQHFNKKFTKKDEEIYVKKILKSKNDFVFSIFLEKDGEYIGQIGIHQISWENKLGRLSIIIKREFWGKNYAKESIPFILSIAFHKLKLHKIWLMSWSTNKKARRLYKKLGFREEGVLKDEYFWRGKYHDIIRMGMLKKSLKYTPH